MADGKVVSSVDWMASMKGGRTVERKVASTVASKVDLLTDMMAEQ